MRRALLQVCCMWLSMVALVAACGTQVGNPDDEELPIRADGGPNAPGSATDNGNEAENPPEISVPAAAQGSCGFVLEEAGLSDGETQGTLDVRLSAEDAEAVVWVPGANKPVEPPVVLVAAGRHVAGVLRNGTLICAHLVEISDEQLQKTLTLNVQLP